MAAIAWADVTAMAPELAAVDVGAQATILAHVNAALSVATFGGEAAPRLRLARILLAAHFGTVALSGGAAPAGPVVSESAGGLSRTYAQASAGGAADSAWSSTSYGRELAALIRSSAARLPVVA